MYGRDSWYPHVGFQTYINSESPRLPSKSLEYWWGSLLDPDALDWIRENYFQKNKDFVYWMTISTHVPPKLLPGAGINPLCDERGEVQACIHLANLRYVMDAVSKTAVELNQTTIVIVGDHPPPFASLSNRHMFKQDLVPYLMLVPKPVM
jgi:phosphoglycerol transferase MdoB-like AlkP superfamily enzyme